MFLHKWLLRAKNRERVPILNLHGRTGSGKSTVCEYILKWLSLPWTEYVPIPHTYWMNGKAIIVADNVVPVGISLTRCETFSITHPHRETSVIKPMFNWIVMTQGLMASIDGIEILSVPVFECNDYPLFTSACVADERPDWLFERLLHYPAY